MADLAIDSHQPSDNDMVVKLIGDAGGAMCVAAVNDAVVTALRQAKLDTVLNLRDTVDSAQHV